MFNPATGEQSGIVPLAGAEEVNEAVVAAKAAFPGWAATTPLRRARILNRFLRLLEENQERSAETIVAEHGKVHSDALGEIGRGVEVVEFATAAPILLKGEITENVGTQVDSHSLRQPLGVVAGITPFNFPAMVPMWMFPVALGLRQLLHPQGLRARAERRPDPGRAPEGGGPAGRRVSGRPWRQGGGRRHPAPSGHRGRELRGLDADGQVHLRRPPPRTGNAARPWAGPRTT